MNIVKEIENDLNKSIGYDDKLFEEEIENGK
jgi:hypothetical protein